MNTEALVSNLLEALVNGDRPSARMLTDACFNRGMTAREVVSEVFWPAYETLERLHRTDKVTKLSHHLATRLLRSLVDQASLRYEKASANGRTIFALCGPNEADELGAQMAVDMLESEGYTVSFSGGGVANDEILERVQARRPDVLLLFASASKDLPEIRSLIDTLHEIGACRDTQVVVGGGVFNRADGLAEEIGADLWASTPEELALELAENPARRATLSQRTVGRKRKAA